MCNTSQILLQPASLLLFVNSSLHFNCYMMFHCRNILNVFVYFLLYNHLYFSFFLLLHSVVGIAKSRSVQFSSVAQLCPALCDTMDKSRYQSEFIRLQSLKNFNITDYWQNAFQNGCLFYTLTSKYESAFGFRFLPIPGNDFCQSHGYDTSRLNFCISLNSSNFENT